MQRALHESFPSLRICNALMLQHVHPTPLQPCSSALCALPATCRHLCDSVQYHELRKGFFLGPEVLFEQCQRRQCICQLIQDDATKLFVADVFIACEFWPMASCSVAIGSFIGCYCCRHDGVFDVYLWVMRGQVGCYHCFHLIHTLGAITGSR